jgi:hypothetical protein
MPRNFFRPACRQLRKAAIRRPCTVTRGLWTAGQWWADMPMVVEQKLIQPEFEAERPVEPVRRERIPALT